MLERAREREEELAAQGTAMMLVEQNVARALQIGDRVFVLRSGELVAGDLDATAVTADELIDRYGMRQQREADRLLKVGRPPTAAIVDSRENRPATASLPLRASRGTPRPAATSRRSRPRRRSPPTTAAPRQSLEAAEAEHDAARPHGAREQLRASL